MLLLQLCVIVVNGQAPGQGSRDLVLTSDDLEIFVMLPQLLQHAAISECALEVVEEVLDYKVVAVEPNCCLNFSTYFRGIVRDREGH